MSPMTVGRLSAGSRGHELVSGGCRNGARGQGRSAVLVPAVAGCECARTCMLIKDTRSPDPCWYQEEHMEEAVRTVNGEAAKSSIEAPPSCADPS